MSNYKLSGNAYSNVRENFDMSHEDAHKFATAIDQNYQNGGGFGYICIPKPTENGQPDSNFQQSTDVECRYAFIGPNLIQRTNPQDQAGNAKEFNEEQYFVFNGSTTGAQATSKVAIDTLTGAKDDTTNPNGLGLE